MRGVATRHRAFGLVLEATVALPELPELAPAGVGPPVDVDLSLADASTVAASFSGPTAPPAVRLAALGTGTYYRTERGVAGDHRIDAEAIGSFHLTAGATAIRCAPAAVDDPAWRRFLLDTVLGTAALIHGHEALHAGAYLTPAGVVAILAEGLGGKSTLLATELRRGARLMADDLLVVDARATSDVGAPVAHPGPPVMNLSPVLPDGTPAAAIGRVVATIEGECWVAVDDAATEPAPLAAVVLLQRGDHGRIEVARLAPSPVPLLRHSLTGGSDRQRIESRFRTCAELADRVPMLALTAPADCAPGALADALDAATAPAVGAAPAPAVPG